LCTLSDKGLWEDLETELTSKGSVLHFVRTLKFLHEWLCARVSTSSVCRSILLTRKTFIFCNLHTA